MNWLPELDELRRREAFARQMGGADKIKRQHDGGRLTVRERVDKLFDKDSFHELGAVAGLGEYDAAGNLTNLTAANCVVGRGMVDGRPVVVVADDFTVRGGSADASIPGKRLMAEEMACEFRMPLIRVIEGSGGGGSVKTIETTGASNLPGGVGQTKGFYLMTAALAQVPVVSLGLGSVAGAGAAKLAASHYSVMTKTSAMFVAGPPVVARLGQPIGKQELGGWEIQTRAGAVDHAVDTEEEAFACARRFLSYLPQSVYGLPETLPCNDDPERMDEALMNAVPRNRRQVYKMRADHRVGGRQGLVLRDRAEFRALGDHGSRTVRRPRGPAARQRSLSLCRRLDRRGLSESRALRRLCRGLSSAGGLPRGLSRLSDRARSGKVGNHPAWRTRNGRDEPVARAVVYGDHPQRVRRRRRGQSAGGTAVAALRLAVGDLGIAAARRRHRGGLSRRDRCRA